MKYIRTTMLTALAITATLVLTPGGTNAAQHQKVVKPNTQMQIKTLRTISPRRGRLMSTGNKLSAGAGAAAVTCCTNWNSSTGGTGCATFPDSCPDDQFEVECGADGCW